MYSEKTKLECIVSMFPGTKASQSRIQEVVDAVINVHNGGAIGSDAGETIVVIRH
jgi:hypothetical protein